MPKFAVELIIYPRRDVLFTRDETCHKHETCHRHESCIRVVVSRTRRTGTWLANTYACVAVFLNLCRYQYRCELIRIILNNLQPDQNRLGIYLYIAVIFCLINIAHKNGYYTILKYGKNEFTMCEVVEGINKMFGHAVCINSWLN